MFEDRGHRRDAEFQFLARTGNRKDRLGLEQPINAQGRAGGLPDRAQQWSDQPIGPRPTWIARSAREALRRVQAAVWAAVDWAQKRVRSPLLRKGAEHNGRSVLAS